MSVEIGCFILKNIGSKYIQYAIYLREMQEKF